MYHMCGLFGSDYNLAVWHIFISLPNLNYAVFKIINLFHLWSTWYGKVLYMATAPEQMLKCLL